MSKKFVQVAGAAAVLGLTLYLVDPAAVVAQFSRLRPGWALLALVISVPNTLLLALRWRFVSRRMGAPLSVGRAVAEYYLAMFANNTLPTGLAGAGLRALRHSRRPGAAGKGQAVGLGPALASVVFERLAGLAALSLFALASALLLVNIHPQIAVAAAAIVLILGGVATLVFSLAARKSSFGKQGFVEQAQEALLRRGAWLCHLLLSSLSVALLCVEFLCAARAIGIPLSMADALLVTPLILSSAMVPLSVAGWGIREASSAAFFAALGLAPSAGVAGSFSFGLLGLIGSAPGAVVWLWPDRS